MPDSSIAATDPAPDPATARRRPVPFRLDFLLLALAYVALFAVGWYDSPRHYIYLIGLLGAAVGAVAGVLVSPYVGEEGQFAAYAQLVAGFLSGYVVSKFDRIFEIIVSPGKDSVLLTAPFLFRFGYCLTAALVTMLLVFAYRRYEEE